MHALLLVLLLGLGESYGPYARPDRGASHSLADGRGNVLLAWNEQGAAGRAHVHVVLLDSSGRAISPVSVLPSLTPGRDALVPAVGTDGTSFLVVWEEVFGLQQSVAMTIGADGVPTGGPRPLTTEIPVPGNNHQPARVSWAGDAYVVLTSTRSGLRVDTGGNVLGTLAAPVPQAVSRNGAFGRAEYALLTRPTFSPGPTQPIPTVLWFAGSQSGREEMLSPAGTPFLTAAGNDFVVTWTTPGILYYRLTNEARHSALADVDQHARPRAACGQTHCVITWATRGGDIEGLVFDFTRPELAPARFTAAASERIEREPEVVMLTSSRALVTWRSSGPDGERLAGRTLHLATPKQRAVR